MSEITAPLHQSEVKSAKLYLYFDLFILIIPCFRKFACLANLRFARWPRKVLPNSIMPRFIGLLYLTLGLDERNYIHPDQPTTIALLTRACELLLLFHCAVEYVYISAYVLHVYENNIPRHWQWKTKRETERMKTYNKTNFRFRLMKQTCFVLLCSYLLFFKLIHVKLRIKSFKSKIYWFQWF